MPTIRNLSVSIEDINILRDINLSIHSGEIHILMGSNGSGKSTLARTIMGFPECIIKEGDIIFDGSNINNLSLTERSKLGIFLAYQYPVEVPGVNFVSFLRIAYNSHLPKGKGINTIRFTKLIEEKAKLLDIKLSLIKKDLNDNMSGGEKKKMEMLQMLILNPRLVILDEIDSGLDIDANRVIYKAINTLSHQNKKTAFLIITHNDKILNFLTPNFVHIMTAGTIIKTGKAELIKEISKHGFKFHK